MANPVPTLALGRPKRKVRKSKPKIQLGGNIWFDYRGIQIAADDPAGGAADATVAGGAVGAADNDPDPNASPEWNALKLAMFGDREIRADGNEIVRLFLNTKADDASTVPVMINGLIDQSEENYIKTQ